MQLEHGEKLGACAGDQMSARHAPLLVTTVLPILVSQGRPIEVGCDESFLVTLPEGALIVRPPHQQYFGAFLEDRATK